MQKFYTNFKRINNDIWIRGYEDKKPFFEKTEYCPSLYLPSKEPEEFQTIYGEYVYRKLFPNMGTANGFIRKQTDLNLPVYGFKDFEFVYIYENYPENFEFDISLVRVVSIDIETDSSKGFVEPKDATMPVTAITLTCRGKSVTWGLVDYHSPDPNRLYYKCDSEFSLLSRFLRAWEKNYPDIITGWNISLYDIPYLVNRIKIVFKDVEPDAYLRLSPFGVVEARERVFRNDGRQFSTYAIGGVADLDYFGLYQKYAPSKRESYKLDFICELEINEKKLDYSEYDSLDELYRKNPQKFIEYNIHDAFLVERLESKLHYIEQSIFIAYTQRVNFENTLNTVKPWDVMVHNYLMDQKIVVPHKSFDDLEVEEQIAGGYVKEPKPGIYRWVGSVDFASLYPSLAMQYNISPECLVKKLDLDKRPTIEEICNGTSIEFFDKLKKYNLCMTANGVLLKRDKRGFIPTLMKKFFDGRKVLKKKFLKLKDELESNKDNLALKYEMEKYNNLQTAFKLIGNSGYGAIANRFFRWFNNDLAEGITLSGQMATNYIVIEVNKMMNKLLKTEDEDYVIYCDTDSAYLSLEKVVLTRKFKDDPEKVLKYLVKFMNLVVVPFINNTCKVLGDRLNVYEVTTAVKAEKICDKALFIRKKRYVLHALYDEGIFIKSPKPKATGLDAVRSQVPALCREALKKCYGLILNDDVQALYSFVEDFKKKFKTLPVGVSGTASGVKGLIKYFDREAGYKKGTPYHVKGTLAYNNMITKLGLEQKYKKIVDYDKIRTYILKVPNPTGEKVIAFSGDSIPKEFGLEAYLDYDKQFHKAFLKPLKNVTDPIGWNTEEVENLDDLMSEYFQKKEKEVEEIEDEEYFYED